MGIFGGLGLGGCNSSCDVLELIVIVAILSKLLKRKDHCGCEERRHDGCGCFNFKLDICTIAILFLLFGGFDKFFGGFGNKCC